MKILHDLRKNWSDWALGAAAVAAIANWLVELLKPSQAGGSFAIASAMLGLLVMLVVDRITERRTVLTNILGSVTGLRWHLAKRGHLVVARQDIERLGLRDRLLGRPYPIGHFVACDFTLFGLLVTNEGLLRECLDQGMHVEFLITNPESVHVPQPAMRWFEGDAADYAAVWAASSRAVDRLIEYSKQCRTGRLDVKYLDFVPFQGFLAIDPSKSHGEIQVMMRVYGLPADRLPMLLIRRDEDPLLYEDFYSEWQLLWSRSNPRTQKGDADSRSR